MQNIQISISFHSTTHNHENTKHMQTQKFKTLDFWKQTSGIKVRIQYVFGY